ncbi:uncharacterized protein LOC119109937 isoform X2 [Pollicipes pollicipes]|uniref:uncharacterized protein LOC119109937 isoform X2 n=1 Tax=Pollicipes pollicipes TaxID=41117 RepID=UPI001884F3AE|nr:uncharacterized protein LOC119109937 isoform X2 [Pollicipes pollicipes]
MLCGYRSVMLSSDSDNADNRDVMPPVRLPMLNVRPTSMLMRRFRSHPTLNKQEITVTAFQKHEVSVSTLQQREVTESLRRQEAAGGHRQGSALDRLWQTDIDTNRGFSVLPSKYSVERRGWDYTSTPSPPRDSFGRPYKGSPTGRPILQPIPGAHSQLHDAGAPGVVGQASSKSSEYTRQESRYTRLPPHREVLTIDRSPEPTGAELNHTLRPTERSHLVFEKGGVGPSKTSTHQEKAVNGKKLTTVSAPHNSEPGHRYSYHGDSPSRRASLLPQGHTHGTMGNGRSNGTEQTDRAFHASSKQSNFGYHDDFNSDSSDEDPNGITLSNTTRSKMKLLAKRNEMRKELDRTNHETGAAQRDRDERSRKFKQLEKEYSSGASVESRLAAKRNGHLGRVPGQSFASPRRSPHPAPLRRAFSQERAQRSRRPSHANHLSPEKPPATLLPSPRMERKSGSMQNLATKPKQPALPKSKTFGAELNKRSIPSSASTVFGDHLEKFGNPKAALEEAYRKLNSDDWEREVSGLTDLVRLFRYHPDMVSGDLKNVSAAVIKQMKNLRSQVLRAAVQTSCEMFQHVGKGVEPNLEKIAAILLQKTSDTNKFIKADSNRSLDVMLDSVSLPRAITAVTSEGLGHRNAQVRCTVARLLATVVQRLGAAGSLSGQRDITDRLVPAAAQLVREGDLQTRKHAKTIFQVWLQHPDLDKVLSKYLSGSVKLDIDKVVDNLKNEVPTPALSTASLT